MKKLFSSLTIISILLLTGCADVKNIKHNEDKDVVLDSKAKTYITIPEDGRYGNGIIYSGSGAIVSGIVLSAFSMKIMTLDLAEKTQSLDEALTYARNQSYDYIISPTILHWEDRNTAWSSRPSKASIRIIVVDVKTGNMIDSAVIDARSSSVRMTDPSPEDALPKPVTDYVNSLSFK